MAVSKMDVLAMGQIGRELDLEGVCGRRETVVGCVKPQRVMVSANVQKKWPSVVSVRVSSKSRANLGLRCSATSGGDNDSPPKKNYDINEVIERVTHEEDNQLPESEKDTPEPLPEGEPSPFSPAIDQEDIAGMDAFQGQGVSKNSMVMPPRAATHESAASSSLGEGHGVSDVSALSADPVGGSPKSGGRDWRVHSSDGFKAKVEKASSIGTQPEQQKQYFGWSEAICDEGSSFMVVAGVLENDGGNSVDDYKLRAHIFAESDAFFSALKKREREATIV